MTSIDWKRLASAVGFVLIVTVWIASIFGAGFIGYLVAGDAGALAGIFSHLFVCAVVMIYIEMGPTF